MIFFNFSISNIEEQIKLNGTQLTFNFIATFFFPPLESKTIYTFIQDVRVELQFFLVSCFVSLIATVICCHFIK